MNLLAPYVTLETVRLQVEVSSRKRLFEEAGSIFEVAYGVAHGDVFDALIARERLGSTCVGAGAAVPHGRIKELREPALVFLRTEKGLPLEAPDGRPVRLFFFLIVPDREDALHLAMLREVASLLSDRSMRQALLEAPDEISVCKLLHDWTPPQGLHPEGSPPADAPSLTAD